VPGNGLNNWRAADPSQSAAGAGSGGRIQADVPHSISYRGLAPVHGDGPATDICERPCCLGFPFAHNSKPQRSRSTRRRNPISLVWRASDAEVEKFLAACAEEEARY